MNWFNNFQLSSMKFGNKKMEQFFCMKLFPKWIYYISLSNGDVFFGVIWCETHCRSSFGSSMESAIIVILSQPTHPHCDKSSGAYRDPLCKSQYSVFHIKLHQRKRCHFTLKQGRSILKKVSCRKIVPIFCPQIS